MRPDPHARAIASVIRDLLQTRDATTYFAEKISGMSMRYNLPGDHPLIGCSAPDFEFEDGTRLGEHLHNGKGLLLDFAGAENLRPRSNSERPVEVCFRRSQRQQEPQRNTGKARRLCCMGRRIGA